MIDWNDKKFAVPGADKLVFQRNKEISYLKALRQMKGDEKNVHVTKYIDFSGLLEPSNDLQGTVCCSRNGEMENDSILVNESSSGWTKEMEEEREMFIETCKQQRTAMEIIEQREEIMRKNIQEGNAALSGYLDVWQDQQQNEANTVSELEFKAWYCQCIERDPSLPWEPKDDELFKIFMKELQLNI